mmetsp:Transcript_105848/g.299415  ORF Transcript_105848/g.299415 Transcript_105848/m.299415 type:complete len:375 (-) Transcript_105848:255-1379(-)
MASVTVSWGSSPCHSSHHCSSVGAFVNHSVWGAPLCTTFSGAAFRWSFFSGLEGAAGARNLVLGMSSNACSQRSRMSLTDSGPSLSPPRPMVVSKLHVFSGFSWTASARSRSACHRRASLGPLGQDSSPMSSSTGRRLTSSASSFPSTSPRAGTCGPAIGRLGCSGPDRQETAFSGLLPIFASSFEAEMTGRPPGSSSRSLSALELAAGRTLGTTSSEAAPLPCSALSFVRFVAPGLKLSGPGAPVSGSGRTLLADFTGRLDRGPSLLLLPPRPVRVVRVRVQVALRVVHDGLRAPPPLLPLAARGGKVVVLLFAAPGLRPLVPGGACRRAAPTRGTLVAPEHRLEFLLELIEPIVAWAARLALPPRLAARSVR